MSTILIQSGSKFRLDSLLLATEVILSLIDAKRELPFHRTPTGVVPFNPTSKPISFLEPIVCPLIIVKMAAPLAQPTTWVHRVPSIGPRRLGEVLRFRVLVHPRGVCS